MRIPLPPSPRGGARRSGRDGPPRLVLRFAVLSALALGLAATAILLVVRHYNAVAAERLAVRQARFAATSIIASDVGRSDFSRRVTARRRAQIDRRLRAHVDKGSLLELALVDGKGHVTYSTDPHAIGRPIESTARWEDARTGRIVSSVTTIPGPRSAGSVHVLETLVPVRFPGSKLPVFVVVYQDYGPIASASRSVVLPVAAVLEIALIGLWAVLVPALVRVTRRLKRHVAEIEHVARHDALTGLANRLLLTERLAYATSSSRGARRAAVLVVDLDRFRDVNDTLGRAAGDALLVEQSRRIERLAGEHATVARLAGDEFAVLLPGAGVSEASRVAAAIRSTLAVPVPLDDTPISVDASVGIAVWPDHGAADGVVQRADMALHAAKRRRSGCEVFDGSLDDGDAKKLALVTELRHGIENGELLLYYQPKADIDMGAIRGVEALARWNHPERGLVPPAEFIPVAERTGLIRHLTRFALEEAVRQSRAWAVSGLDVAVAVNLTPIDLVDESLPDDVSALLARYRVPPSRLELEITETAIMADPDRVARILERLSTMGVRLAIDDFGTGYTSLGYLKALPVHSIKIDRAFVAGMVTDRGDATIVRSIIDIAHNLGLSTVAEGVETPEIWQALLLQGCDQVQGWFVGHPGPPESLEEILRLAARPVAADGDQPGSHAPELVP